MTTQDQEIKKRYEHISVSDPKFDELDSAIRQSYPNCCIVQIQKVLIDPILEEKFLKHYERFLKKDVNTKIVQLYHGTGLNSIYSIITDGFLTSKNTTSAYGLGTYFSNSSTMSQSYAYNKSVDVQGTISYMIVADVVISDKVIGHYGINKNLGNMPLRMTPQQSSGNENNEKIPSCYVNNLTLVEQRNLVDCNPFHLQMVHFN